MKVFKGLACTAGLAACILSAPAQAGTVAGFGGSTEITQLANNLEMVNQSIMQMRMVEMQLKNLVRLDGIADWNSAVPLLQNVMRTVQGAQSIAWQGQMADQQFRRLYGTVTGTGVNYGNQYGLWRSQTLSSTRAALNAAGMQLENFQTESDGLATLKRKSKEASGQLDAVQAGTQIAANTVEQLQSLRALQAAQIQMQAAALQEVSSQNGGRCEAEFKFFGGRNCTVSEQ